MQMRRAQQALDEQTCLEVLARCTSGVLSLVSPDGLPYGVPLSYVYGDGRLVFHGAREGLKARCLAAGGRASFCVIDVDDPVPAELTTRYRSVICSGAVRVLDDASEQHDALMALGLRFLPEGVTACEAEVEKFSGRTLVFALEVEEMTGKESRALARERKEAAGAGC